jgi:putative transposase
MPGQAANITQAVPLIDEVEPEAIIADKGYDSDGLVDKLDECGITPVIPWKANRKEPRKTDFALYRERNLVERFFNKLTHYRGIATPFDKTLPSVHGASARSLRSACPSYRPELRAQ